MDVRATIAIPARLHSERLSEKPLKRAGGFSLVVHTAMAALKSTADAVVVLSDDERAFEDLPSGVFKSRFPTAPWCGTQRIAHAVKLSANLPVAKEFPGFGDIIINLQCDEPNIKPSDLDKLIDETECSDGGIATLVAPLDTQSESDSSVVKAIVQDGKCVDFRRTGAPLGSMHHVGCYGFKKDVLFKIGELEQSERSRELSLEQLTWLDNGYEIDAVQIDEAPLSVNTMADYEKWVASFGRVLQ